MSLSGVVEIISGRFYVRSKFYRDKKEVDSLTRVKNGIEVKKDNIVEYKFFEEDDMLFAEPIKVTGHHFQR